MSVLAIGGCTTWEALWGNVRGPVSGKLMSPAEAQAEAQRETQRIADEAKAKVEAELAAARGRKADFELAAARLGSDCEFQLRGLANKYDQDEALGKAALAGIDQWQRQKSGEIEANLARTMAKYDQDRGALGAVFDAVAGPAAMVPWGGTALAGLLAVTGFRRASAAQAEARTEKEKAIEVREELAGLRVEAEKKIREAADTAWTEAKAEAKEEAENRDRHYTMGQDDLTKNSLITGGLRLAVTTGATG